MAEQIAAHAEYIKAAAVETVGSVTGSEEWTKSGEEQKQAAIDHMHAVHSTAPPPSESSVLGNIEKTAGSLVGCEGMVEEGGQRLPHGVDGATSTGGEGRGMGGEPVEESKKLV